MLLHCNVFQGVLTTDPLVVPFQVAREPAAGRGDARDHGRRDAVHSGKEIQWNAQLDAEGGSAWTSQGAYRIFFSDNGAVIPRQITLNARRKYLLLGLTHFKKKYSQ